MAYIVHKCRFISLEHGTLLSAAQRPDAGDCGFVTLDCAAQGAIRWREGSGTVQHIEWLAFGGLGEILLVDEYAEADGGPLGTESHHTLRPPGRPKKGPPSEELSSA